jgi:fucose 4-O-acetylase-like acetyltransferase
MHAHAVQRYHSLDALRAAMMLLGLVLHSAASYTQTPLGWAWPYHDPQRSAAFDLLIFFIHLFRMPVFFAVAGFFAALLYYRDGPGGFVRNRARRVLLPLVMFWGLVVPLAGFGFIFALRQVVGRTAWPEIINQPLLQRPLLGHLWFLYDLLLFYAAAVVFLPLAARLPAAVRQRGDIVFRGVVENAWGAIVLAAVTTLTLMPMRAPAIETSAALLPPVRVLAAYGVFFGFGWLLYRQRDLIPSLGARWKAPLSAGAAASVGYLMVIVNRSRVDPTLWHLAGAGLASLSMWLLVFGMLGGFVRHMDKPRPLVRYFSDASYWMYLVHLAPTTWIPALLARSSAPAVVKFAVVLGLTTLLTTATYHYMVRSTAIGELLNGRRYPRSLRSAGPAIDRAGA